MHNKGEMITMVYSPYDFNEAIGHRKEYIEGKLAEGSPVVGVSCHDGLLLLTLRKSQRKVFEIYDRLIYSAIGSQSDIEAIRIGAIDVAHKEGFERSPDDITAQRLVGFSLSPPLKRLFGDQFNSPAVIRAVFGEMGNKPEEDVFFILNYDGEFSQHHGHAVIAGLPDAEDKMEEELHTLSMDTTMENALESALRAWTAGARFTLQARTEEYSREHSEIEDHENILKKILREGELEVGMLERFTKKESKFRMLNKQDINPLLIKFGIE
jgi:proteasome alpha subunit